MQRFILYILILFIGTPAFAQSNCDGWGNGVDSIKTRRYYEEYRKLLSSYNYQEAEFFWGYVFRKAPGATKNVYLDGVKLYKHLYESEKNEGKKDNHLQKIVDIFDKRANCNPTDKGNILSRKALELQKLKVDDLKVLEAFKMAAETGDQMPSFALVPYSKLVSELFLTERITEVEHKAIQDQLIAIAENNINAEQDANNYHAAKVNVGKAYRKAVASNEDKIRREEIAASEPLTECEQKINAYKKSIKANPENDLMISKMINALRNMDCDEAGDYMGTLMALQDNNMRKKMEGSSIAARSGNTIANANFAFKNGNFEKAVELYNQAIDETVDVDKQAKYHYQIAKIQYAKLDDKASAKKHLLEVMKLQPKNGEAYILLGDIYLAGAKDCFPTDMFTQKMVIYASINKWKKAKETDPVMADEANQRISKYKNYLPTKSELFLARSRFKGKTYRIGCWINEKVKVKMK